ncbi:hypothetical protein N7D90_15875 [Pseudomonas fragi]|uniref:hypothetical protein n=1 Tax=Pseudomonas fragi TaxID=296 RepID=UPI0021C204D5|nr:hypothetical protein [Pseudomonas fragi]UXL37059.1 hypothetical protein N7D90_15875 [Pseudomonas fragi]
MSFFWVTGCGNSEFSRLAPKDKLPVEFSNYQYIDDISVFEGGYVIERFKYSAPGRMRYSINKSKDNVIIEVVSSIDDQTRKFSFYKLSALGCIIGEHNFIQSTLVARRSGTEELVGASFLVNKVNSYYTTWPVDGDRQRKPFVPINKDLAWSAEKVDAYYAAILEKAARVDSFIEFEAVSVKENKARTRVVYYLNSTGRWYVLFGDSLRGGYTGKGLHSGENIIFKDFGSGVHLNEEYSPPANITIPYFQKTDYRKTVSAGGGSTNSASSVSYHLDGIGYFQVVVNGSVLKFKNKGVLSRREGGSHVFPSKESLLSGFSYYTSPSLKYSLLLVNDMLYVIRAKNCLAEISER